MSNFSQEILDLFVDTIEYSYDGYKALRACMMVSWSLFLRARSRVFSKVELGLFVQDNLQDFIKLLKYRATGYPQLGPCVKTLTICWGDKFLYDNSIKDECKIAVLLLLSQPLYKVVTLEFHFSVTDFSRLRKNEKAYRAFRSICTVSTLKSLRLATLDYFPPDIFNICQLEELHLYEASFRIPSSSLSTPLINANLCTPASRMRRFSLRSPGNLPPAWYEPSTSPFSSLQSLLVQLSRAGQDFPHHCVDLLLSISQNSLQNLVLYLEDFQQPTHSLQPLKVLRTLAYKSKINLKPGEAALNRITESILAGLATMTIVPVSWTTFQSTGTWTKMELTSILRMSASSGMMNSGENSWTHYQAPDSLQ
ncbi:hypothetical protein CPB83DRAFT_840068 [Crepidotus variabilis]|uniref:Uncharacterized protein n=1 Tax=Crepidotus variabilis TaxID=179855 RepID=A0A9P6E5N7_9AGAR|nr:hypothetical protein CPB83DRAFT_840068 [Crepidotus variabilis]